MNNENQYGFSTDEKLENEKIEITGNEKEPVKKLSNREVNNNITLDLIVKTSKLQQMLNVIMDYNNTADLDVVISPETFKELQDTITNLFCILKGVVESVVENYNNITNKDK